MIEVINIIDWLWLSVPILVLSAFYIVYKSLPKFPTESSKKWKRIHNIEAKNFDLLLKDTKENKV